MNASHGGGGTRPAVSPGWVEADVVEEEELDNQYADARDDVFGTTGGRGAQGGYTASELGQWEGGGGEKRVMTEGRRYTGRRG